MEESEEGSGEARRAGEEPADGGTYACEESPASNRGGVEAFEEADAIGSSACDYARASVGLQEATTALGRPLSDAAGKPCSPSETTPHGPPGRRRSIFRPGCGSSDERDVRDGIAEILPRSGDRGDRATARATQTAA
jgi:hypothetical protein